MEVREGRNRGTRGTWNQGESGSGHASASRAAGGDSASLNERERSGYELPSRGGSGRCAASCRSTLTGDKAGWGLVPGLQAPRPHTRSAQRPLRGSSYYRGAGRRGAGGARGAGRAARGSPAHSGSHTGDQPLSTGRGRQGKGDAVGSLLSQRENDPRLRFSGRIAEGG